MTTSFTLQRRSKISRISLPVVEVMNGRDLIALDDVVVS
jgi:hypothetical protein